MIRPYAHADYPNVREIFWETSSKTEFESEQVKERFQNIYLDYYLDHKDFIGLIYENDEDDKEVQGYIIGLKAFDNELFNLHPIYKNFSSLIKDYPSELHINLTGETQGKGVGSQLISDFENNLNTTGVFLLTSKHVRNFNFYLKNYYQVLKELENGVVFMGKSL